MVMYKLGILANRLIATMMRAAYSGITDEHLNITYTPYNI